VTVPIAWLRGTELCRGARGETGQGRLGGRRVVGGGGGRRAVPFPRDQLPIKTQLLPVCRGHGAPVAEGERGSRAPAQGQCPTVTTFH